jgi:protein TonB
MTARPTPEAVPPPISAAPPQPAVRPAPESPLPPAAPRETLPESLPSPRSGLSLGGAAPTIPGPAAPPVSPREGVSRPSLRDQLAKLGSGLTADAGGTAKRTLDLDNREPRYFDYLARLKRRIQGEWTYPEEARQVGMGGELLLVFTLNKAGTLINVQLVETSGFPVLDNEALRAVKAAAPYDPFPPHMGAEPWNISAIFRYQSPYRFRRN